MLCPLQLQQRFGGLLGTYLRVLVDFSWEIQVVLSSSTRPRPRPQPHVHSFDAAWAFARAAPMWKCCWDVCTCWRALSRCVLVCSRAFSLWFQGLLTENLCSLKSKVDRFAFSVLWEMSPSAEILSVRYCKSSIHSKAAMTYAEAQALLDDPSINTPIATAVRNLNTIARHLRSVRPLLSLFLCCFQSLMFGAGSKGIVCPVCVCVCSLVVCHYALVPVAQEERVRSSCCVVVTTMVGDINVNACCRVMQTPSY